MLLSSSSLSLKDFNCNIQYTKATNPILINSQDIMFAPNQFSTSRALKASKGTSKYKVIIKMSCEFCESTVAF
jgi:hypothetical protein